MATHRGRGRPRHTKLQDEATPELRRRHQQGLTLAPLERLLREERITPLEHWAGIHLRRLHVMLYGNGAAQSGFYWLAQESRIHHCEETLRRMAEEYMQARQYLIENGMWRECLTMVLADSPSISKQLEAQGVEGCRILVRLWCK